MDETYDVVVIGGGAAGLSGALALARSRRRVLVIDGGDPRNAPAAGVHNYLGREGTPPGELYKIGREEVAAYGVQFASGRVVDAAPGFTVTLDDGRRFTGRRLLVATGTRDGLPDVPGVAARWGQTVLHCPFCHGWEVRDEPIGVIATGPMAVHQALMWRQITADLVYFTHTGPELTGEQRGQFAARGIFVEPRPVAAVEEAGARLADGTLVARAAFVVQTTLTPRLDGLDGLGLPTAEKALNGHVMATHLPVEPTGATSVAGVYAAGNVSDPMAQVVVSAAQGLMAGAAINGDLVMEETRQAVADA